MNENDTRLSHVSRHILSSFRLISNLKGKLPIHMPKSFMASTSYPDGREAGQFLELTVRTFTNAIQLNCEKRLMSWPSIDFPGVIDVTFFFWKTIGTSREKHTYATRFRRAGPQDERLG